MQNPFVFGPIVRGENFCGRESELRELRMAVASGMHVVLYSRRRTGKTSLIGRFLEDMGDDCHCVYLDLSRVTTQQEFFEDYANQVLKAARPVYSSLQKMVAKLRDLLGRVEVSLSAGPDEDLSFGLDLASLPGRRIPELLALPEHLGGRFVIALDEYQNVVNLPGEYDMEPFMRSVVQHFEHTSLLFAGSRAHMMRDIFSNPERPHYRLARGMSLGPLDEEEALTFMDRKFSTSGREVPRDDLQLIYKIVSGDPYYLQALCFSCWEALVHEEVLDVSKATNEMVVHEGMYFEAMWRYLTPVQRSVLKSIAAGENPYGGKLPKSSVAQALKSLQEKDFLEIPERGTYRLTDPFFGQWTLGSVLDSWPS